MGGEREGMKGEGVWKERMWSENGCVRYEKMTESNLDMKKDVGVVIEIGKNTVPSFPTP